MSVDTAKIIKAIGDQHQLHIDEIGKVADETGLVLFGFTRPHLFAARLARTLNLDQTKANDIAHEIDLKIFAQVRDYLKNPPLETPVAKPGQNIFNQKMQSIFETGESDDVNLPPAPSRLADADPYRESVE